MQKTYKGQTAGGILRTAKAIKMQAGNSEIVVRDRDGEELFAALGDRPGFAGGLITDVLVLFTLDGVVARLSTSDKALARLAQLEAEL